MAETYYPSEEKYNRAKAAVENYDRNVQNHPDKAEYKLVAEGRAKKLEGEELVKFVYEGLSGSPIITGAPAVEAKKKATEAKKRSVKKREAALRRERINVK